HFIQARGDNFDAEMYPKLATVYPSGTLPDLRGEFIRGWDDGRGVDAGRSILDWQKGTAIIQEINTVVDAATAPSLNSRDVMGSDDPGSVAYSIRAKSIGGAGSGNVAATWTASGAYVGVTRPRNVAYNIIVRAL